MAILVHHPAQHLASAVVVEVGIDIGEVHTVGVEETLEQQVVLERVYARNAQTVGHYRARSRATARTYPHTEVATGGIDEV